MSDEKIVNLGEKLRTKAVTLDLRRRLSRTIREMLDETGATPQEIASVLNEAADDLARNSNKPA